MKRARIVPKIVQSQYSQTPTLLDGFNLIIEGSITLHFPARGAAEAYASAHNITLAYSG